MKKILFLLLLAASLVAAQNCPQGHLRIDGACQPISYIPGCTLYTKSGRCSLCQYGYQIQQGKCSFADKPTTNCCVLTNNQGVCSQCAPGLVLDGNSCVRFSRPGCLQGKGSQCINCANDYQNIRGKCFKRLSNCRSYDDQGVCKQCSSGFQLIRGLCSSIISRQVIQNCRTANQYGCSICQNGFYLTKDGRCKLNQPGCIKHYRQLCITCQTGLKLINGKCVMDGCSQYSSEGCRRCSSPYVLSNKACVLENCLQSLNGQCIICRNQFRVKNGLCVRPIADRCNSCANGFFVGQNGRCIRTTLACLKYSADGRCSQCSEPFVLLNGTCSIPGCQKLGPKGCETCFRPFEILSGRCVIRFCSSYNYQQRRCISCQVGNHIQKGICVNNDQNCSSYSLQNDDEICTKCQSDNFILNQNNICLQRRPGCVYQYGKCISCAFPFKRGSNSECVIQGCSRYNLNGCAQCLRPFSQRRGECVIENCQQISNARCTKCYSGYFVRSGICVENDPRCSTYKDEQCVNCIDGFTLNSNKVCVRLIQFCRRYGNDACQQCLSGYQIIGGRCLVTDKFCQSFDGKGCIRCRNNYHLQSGICRINDQSCAAYSEPSFTQRCIQCSSGMVLKTDGSTCVRQVAGCIYDTKGFCKSCRSPFIYERNTCVLTGCSRYSTSGCLQCSYPFVKQGDICIITFCSKYSENGQVCVTCQSGYKIIQGKCFRQDPKCTEYNKAGQCISCIKQHTLFQGICVREDANCLRYSKQGGCNKCKDRYYVSPDSNCLPEQPGCVYQNGRCSLCNHPFKMNEKSQKCRIDGCIEAVVGGCTKCKYPYQRNKVGECEIPNCVTVTDNHCVRCTPGYHLKQGLTCARDQKSCLRYNDDGDCELCDKGFMLMSSGECEIAQDNCIQKKKNGQCVACTNQYFVNKFYQCQKKDVNCQQYNNGFCVQCKKRFFLYQLICFPYSPGCVQYQGKDCIKCRNSYSMRNGQCFSLKKPSLKLQGQDQNYDFEITPIDITKSKYSIQNLSPVSKLGKVFYSSFFNTQFTDPRLNSQQDRLFTKGWKAQNARDGQYIGYIIDDQEPVTFYAIQIEGVGEDYIRSFYIEYSVDGINYIRIQKSYDITSKELTTVYFVGLYARAIRIVVKGYYGWPAARIQFFYYDVLRFRKISNLKSLKYLKESIQSNFVDRMQNQMFINQRAYFNPAKSCVDTDVCFTGLELCQVKSIKSLSITNTAGTLSKIYITYSLDGRHFNCFQQCRHVLIDQKQPSTLVILSNLQAKNIRVYPVEWTGTPNIKVTYDYS